MASSEKKTIPMGPGQPSKTGVDVEVLDSTESWNIYRLADGSVIRMKPILSAVFKVEDEYDADGNPSYILKAANVTYVDSPESLRKKP